MFEITYRTTEDLTETLSEAFFGAGALSVTVEDADAGTVDETPVFAEPGVEPKTRAWKRSLVKVLVEDDFDETIPEALLAKTLGEGVFEKLSREPLPEVDWVKKTQAQFTSQRIGRLWIVPSWETTPEEKDAVVLHLDPGVAFGTGSHPTTRMCLTWLESHVKAGDRLLDWGTGTGILAIAAAKLGAREVAGNDIDSQAIEAARENARKNGVTLALSDLASTPEGPFDIIVANILAGPLAMLAPDIVRRLKVGGTIVLSGILNTQAQTVIEAYLREGAQRAEITSELEDWVCITATKE
ncbi:MAG TPA: 50S ribosomal protein L11 methyltransferase [Sutterella sp.]|nr:50S ribosomal protein L11 methyltransferase [Sutterella sp.]